MATKYSVVTLFLDTRCGYVPKGNVSSVEGDRSIELPMVLTNALFGSDMSVYSSRVRGIASQCGTELLECSQGSRGSEYRRSTNWSMVKCLCVYKSSCYVTKRSYQGLSKIEAKTESS
jgi:hypothetical protein